MVARMRDWCAKQSKGPRKRKNGLLPPSLVELRRTRSSHPPSPEGGASADRSAPRNDMVGPFNFIGASPLTDKNPCSRDTDCPSFAQDVVPREQEGAGNAECALHPRSRVQVAQRNAHTSIQVQRRQSGIPCAMALRLIPRSPRRANSSCHRRCRLDSASDPVGSMPPPTAWHQQRVSGPHGFAVR
jgi:hypothetical protein